MARGINKVILIGNLGQDPEIRATQSGKAVATLNLATDESYKDKQTNQIVPVTEWHRVVLFDRLGEIARDYLKKGSKVYIEGRLKTRKWQDQQGQDRYTTEIIGAQLQMLDSAPNGTQAQPNPAQGYQPNANGYQPPNAQTRAPQAQPQNQGYQPNGAGAPIPDFDDDIPFQKIDSFSV